MCLLVTVYLPFYNTEVEWLGEDEDEIISHEGWLVVAGVGGSSSSRSRVCAQAYRYKRARGILGTSSDPGS